MHRFKCLLLVFILILPITQASSEESIASQSLSNLLGSIDTLSGEFTQALSDANGDIFETSSGYFFLAQPNKVKWVVVDPMPQEIVSNGKDLWIYDPDLEQVIIQPYDSELVASPANLFSSKSKDLDNEFDITLIDSELATKRFLLKPIATSTLYQTFYQTLKIEFQSHKPVSLEFTDALEQSTRIDLKNIVVNSKLADKLFVFEIPPNIDIVNHVD